MFFRATVLWVVMLASIPFLAQADCATNWMDCTADSHVSVNSFPVQAADMIGSIATARLKAVHALKRHKITVAQAKAVQVRADQARATWQRALRVCQANRYGTCINADATIEAFGLLAQAQRDLQ